MRFSKFYTLLIIFLGAVAMASPYGRSQDILGLIGLGSVNFILSVDKDSFDLKISLMKKQNQYSFIIKINKYGTHRKSNRRCDY